MSSVKYSRNYFMITKRQARCKFLQNRSCLVTFIFFDPKKTFKNWGHGLAPTGNLSNVTCRQRDTRDTNKRSKRGQKSKFSKEHFIFQKLAKIEATAKDLSRWDFF